MQNKIIKKPWGSEELIELNSKYCLKKLFMKKGHRCSLQFHKKKIETIFIVSGNLKIFYGKNRNKLNYKTFKTQNTITINPKTIHRMQAQTDCLYLEASTPEITDVVRLSDDYKRKVV